MEALTNVKAFPPARLQLRVSREYHLLPNARASSNLRLENFLLESQFSGALMHNRATPCTVSF